MNTSIFEKENIMKKFITLLTNFLHCKKEKVIKEYNNEDENFWW